MAEINQSDCKSAFSKINGCWSLARGGGISKSCLLTGIGFGHCLKRLQKLPFRYKSCGLGILEEKGTQGDQPI